MTVPWHESRTAFAEAAQWFVETTGRVAGRWERPGLGEWDVRALVGHTSRALATVETYLARPAPQVDVESATDYYLATRAIAAGMRLADYLPTRTFELVVHTTDLCVALELPPHAPPAPARQALDIVAALALADGRAPALLMAATGRAALPAGFTVL